ncbi:hypothetical protein POM88_041124 [Heracleum sosnowskyi]|uniref:Serine-threonine/tyrosine-protein kinase catalytic domain-containing protein n=1 Tax=Heracleum sosnowskyi TaxID=360622 RepID=A0AAD8HG15_9APIA|nr:hypothetical protein POM88_041124 [Heracleum sosnowskyi]
METVKKLDVTTSKENIYIESEVKIISNVHHRNIICLLGCSGKGPVKLLVYKYMENGSIGMFLYGNEHGTLNWKASSFMFTYMSLYPAALGKPQAVVPEESDAAGEAVELAANNQNKKKGMVLPFEQHSITFDDIKYSVDMPQGSAKRLVKAALQEVARKRETRYSDCRRIEKKVQRHFHDDITVVVLFLNHDLI